MRMVRTTHWSGLDGWCAQIALAALALIACAPSAPSLAQSVDPTITRPAGSGRVVQFFDFEEQEFNPDPVPRYWVRSQHAPPYRERPGYPSWNRAAFDKSVAFSGTTSVMLPTRGGSTSLRLVPNLISIFADADYLVSAKVKTTNLKHARAFLSARLLTQQGLVVMGSQTRSEPIISVDGWTTVEITIPARSADAATLQIELDLLQPKQAMGLPGVLSVPEEDLTGSAWFDDVGVFQLPRILISPRDADPVVVAPAKPSFVGIIRDLTGEALSVKLTLTNDKGQVIATDQRVLIGGGGTFDWSPTLPSLGWYAVTMDVSSGEKLSSRAHTAVLWTTPSASTPGRRGEAPSVRADALAVQIVADTASATDAPSMARLIESTGAGSATIPIDDALADKNVESLTAPPIRALLDRILAADMALTLSIAGIPADLAQTLGLDPIEPLALITRDERQWSPRWQSMLDLYGQRVNRWQVGATPVEISEPPLTDELVARAAAFRTWLGKMVPGPNLTLPWRGDWAGAPGNADMGVDGVNVLVPLEWSAAMLGIGLTTPDARASDPERVLQLQSLSSDTFGSHEAAASLLQRAVTLWAEQRIGEQPEGSAGSPPRTRIGFREPWMRSASSRPALLPTPELAVVKAVVDHLAGRKVIGTLRAAPGVRALVIASPESSSGLDGLTRTRRPGAIVAWSEGAQPADARIRTYLGSASVTRVDLYGNATNLKPIDPSGLFDIPLDSTPIFIEGIDPELCLFTSSFGITPDFVPAVAAIHEHSLVLTNPWNTRISGTVQLQSPDSRPGRIWTYSPVAPMTFSIGPGAIQKLPISFSFPASSESGSREIYATIKLTAQQAYPPMRLTVPITIGSRDLDLSVVAALGPSTAGPDVVLTVSVTNTGQAARTLQVDVQGADVAQQRQPISNLLAGEGVVRRFVFPGAAQILSGKRLRVTLSDVDGAERLNKLAVVP